MKQIQNLAGLRNAEEFNSTMAQLPVAEEYLLFATDKEFDNRIQDNNRKAIIVNNKLIDTPSKYYKVVQHSEAFRPIVEGLTLTGSSDFKFSVFYNNKIAELNLFTTSITDGMSDIFLGFKVKNSFNRSTKVSYGMTLSSGHQYIEIVGYRKVCSNGMMMRVPLEQAEIIQPELRQKIESLIQKGFAFKHSAGVYEKIENIQYIVEAMSLLKAPIKATIDRAKNFTFEDKTKVEELLIRHFKERVMHKIMSRYNSDLTTEGDNLWSLYNAITYEASHGEISISKKNNMLEGASNVLAEALNF